MDVVVGKRWEPLLDELVENGSYTSAEDVVAEGLRLVEARQQKFEALKAKIDASIARGGSNSDEDLSRHLAVKLASLRAEGY